MLKRSPLSFEYFLHDGMWWAAAKLIYYVHWNQTALRKNLLSQHCCVKMIKLNLKLQIVDLS